MGNDDEDDDDQTIVEHWRFVDLEELFPGSGLADAFNDDAGFRDDLRRAMRRDVFASSYEHKDVSDVARRSLLDPDSSLQGRFDLCVATGRLSVPMDRCARVLADRLGPDRAPSGEAWVRALLRECSGDASLESGDGGVRSYHWIDIVGVRHRRVAHSWHQDAPSGRDDRRTVVLGFPAEDDYVGTGVFSHAVRLTRPRTRRRSEHDDDDDDGTPLLCETDVPEKFVVRPVYAKGRELLSWRDVDVLHSAPDVAYRTSLMRFMDVTKTATTTTTGEEGV